MPIFFNEGISIDMLIIVNVPHLNWNANHSQCSLSQLTWQSLSMLGISIDMPIIVNFRHPNWHLNFSQSLPMFGISIEVPIFVIVWHIYWHANHCQYSAFRPKTPSVDVCHTDIRFGEETARAYFCKKKNGLVLTHFQFYSFVSLTNFHLKLKLVLFAQTLFEVVCSIIQCYYHIVC